MQERYLGDVHDYFKFTFLKFLSLSLQQKIGLNWYLVNPSSIGTNEIIKKDGEKRNLSSQSIIELDKKLFKEMSFLKNPINRDIHAFTKKTHLKKFLIFFNEEITLKNREKWFKQSLTFFKKQDVIFLDPDNGIKEIMDKQKQSLKYTFLREVEFYIKQNKTIIFTQFQSFNKHHLELVKKIYIMFRKIKIELQFPIIRNRTAPNTFFFTVSNSQKKELVNIYKRYAEFNKKIELIYM